ncbi:MAG: hypothetical protein L3J13_08625 [Devosiaceae bacterium]|nr:hypothetical protein [Devosiaceae bacterium]
MSREADRVQKQREKEQITANAADAVMDWRERIDDLVSLHKNLTQPFDWKSIAHSQPPQLPVRLQTYQQNAQSALDAFKPSLLDKIRGGSQKRLAKLQTALSTATEDDHQVYQLACTDYNNTLAEYEADTSIAKRLVAGEVDAIKEVISEMQTLSAEADLGTRIDFTIKQNSLHAKANLFDTSVVPDFRRKQLASGKLSETKMPVGEFYELYQDYVASAAFRIAGDMLNILPLHEVYVTCLAEMLDTSTGHLDHAPILSVQFVRPTFERLNLDAIDPSDALKKFNHVMNFKQTNGFSKITPL